jgi:uncharacterized protein YjaZ
MTDWHEDSAARSRRLRGEKTVEQRLADIEARLSDLEQSYDERNAGPALGYEDVRAFLKWNTLPESVRCAMDARKGLGIDDHDPLGR